MIDSWYEVRVDGEKVAAFAPSETQGSFKESLAQAYDIVKRTRFSLYRDRLMQIVHVNIIEEVE